MLSPTPTTLPIAIHSYVRYRGTDPHILRKVGNLVLRVKLIHKKSAACFVRDHEPGVWLLIRDLERVPPSELEEELQKQAARAVAAQAKPQAQPAKAPVFEVESFPPEEDPQSAAVVGTQVLLNQPDPHQQRLWQLALESQGVKVVPVGEAELMETISRHRPHLLIQDLGSVRFNPAQFYRDCRRQYPTIKVILTFPGGGNVPPQERKQLMAEGIADVVPALQLDSADFVQTIVDILYRLNLDVAQLDLAALYSEVHTKKPAAVDTGSSKGFGLKSMLDRIRMTSLNKMLES